MSPGPFIPSRSWRWPWAGALALPVFGLLWQSFFWLDRVPIVTKVAYAGLTVLSAMRPTYGLLVIAALATLGGPIGDLAGAPHERTTEALVLTFLVGWLARTVVRRESILDKGDSLSAPIALFALTVSASLVVTSAAVQSATAPPWQYIRLATDLLAHDYFGGTYYETHNWYHAALLVEGGLLVAAVLQLARRRPDLQIAVARMLAVGITSAAVLSLVRLAMGLMRAADPVGFLFRAATAIRISVHTPDWNAAGSHFVLALPVLWALGMMAGRWRPAWVLSIIPVVAALWLSGSRAAQFSILLMLAAVVALSVGRHARMRLILVAVVLITTIGGVIASRPGPESSVVTTLQIRWMFAQTSWGMFRSAPFFGEGIAEYYGRSTAFMPARLKAQYPAENAHNNFIQIGVELGMTGLGIFLWLLASAWRRARRGLLAGADLLLRGLLLGLATAILTFLTGHPLLIGAFACSFWIALALAVTRADTVDSQSANAAQRLPAQAGIPARATWRPRVVAVVALVIVVSVPFRAYLARDEVNLSGVQYGFATGEIDPVSKQRFQWAGPRATVFVPTHAQSLYLSASSATDDDSLELELRIDGRLANRVVLRDGFWRDMRLILPVTGSTHPFRRIDLTVRRTSGDSRPGLSPSDSNAPRVRVRTIRAK
ncbi:MAG: O-antigen ligase family protein [Acidobacteria bacterium]|nr:O-antigen ligase family protein [Acidobacteriota bacterium]